MIENRENEWQNLQTKMTQMLEKPRLLPKDLQIKNFNQTLHLWVSPTFTPEKHWIFYTPQLQINPQPKPMVQQIIWQRETDFQRLNDPLIGLQEGFHIEPTFEIKTIEIESEFYRKLRAELAKIKLPPFIEEEMNGHDGEIFGMETLNLFYSGRITWWSSPPVKWKELVDWYEKVRRFLEEKFK